MSILNLASEFLELIFLILQFIWEHIHYGFIFLLLYNIGNLYLMIRETHKETNNLKDNVEYMSENMKSLLNDNRALMSEIRELRKLIKLQELTYQ